MPIIFLLYQISCFFKCILDQSFKYKPIFICVLLIFQTNSQYCILFHFLCACCSLLKHQKVNYIVVELIRCFPLSIFNFGHNPFSHTDLSENFDGRSVVCINDVVFFLFNKFDLISIRGFNFCDHNGEIVTTCLFCSNISPDI